jgi:hypothetical protein
MRVDVRDNNYVWREGIVYRTFNKLIERKIKYVVIKYNKAK